MIRKVLAVMGRHKFAVILTFFTLGLPLLMVMAPIFLVLLAIWLWVALDECKRL